MPFAHKLQKLFKLPLPFRRIPDDEGGAERDAGDRGADPGEQFPQLQGGDPPPHGTEDRIGDVLDGDVERAANVRMRVEALEHVGRETCRERIEKPDPFYPFYPRDAVEEAGKSSFAVEIEPIVRAVLGDEDDFLHAESGEALSFEQDALPGLALVGPPHQRDRAKRTGPVASLGDFQVGKMPRSREHPFPEQLVLVAPPAARTAWSILFAPTKTSTSGISLRSSSAYRSERQPMTTTFRMTPDFLSSTASRIESIDSCLAASMNPQVLMMAVSVSPVSEVNSSPLCLSWLISSSESTTFLEHPRVTILIFRFFPSMIN